MQRKLIKETPQIIEAYRNGEVLRKIANFYNVSPGTIRNILKRAEVPLRSKGRRRREEVERSIL